MKKRILQFRMTVKTVMIGLLLGAIGVMNGYAQNFTVGDLNYSVNEDEISVTVRGHVNGIAASGELSIPDSVIYNGGSYAVTGIRNQAFMGCSGLIGSLVIPNSITKIGEYAFKNCTGFNGTLTIGTAVTHIEEEAFANTGFTTVNFNPTNCTKMGYYREDGDWYGSPVFKDCPTITTLNMGENVTKIPTGAFKSCSGLTGDLSIPGLVTSIGYEAFHGCNGFNGILTIPSSVTYIGEMAFNNCSGFNEIDYNAINCGGREEGETVFYGCTAFLIIGNGVLKIPDYLFCSGSFTGNLIIPQSVTRIGEGAFSGCYHLTGNLTIPNSVVSIGNWAFSGCSHFSGTLTIGNSVSSMGYLAFANCGFSEIHYNATSCTGLTPIYNYLGHRPPFEGCSAELMIGENVITIPSNMFRDQYNGVITGNLTIPNSVKTIGDYAFAGNRSLTGNLSLSDSLVSIGDYAFSGCYFLNENINIPNSVTSVGENAFQGTGWYAQQPDGILYLDNWCLGYKGTKPTGSLLFQEGTKGIAAGAFLGCSGLTGNLTIPNTISRLPKYAFYGCTGLDGVLTIPNSIVSIRDRAFYNCNHLTTVYYNASNCAFSPQSYNTNYPFENCSGNLVIGDEVETLPDYIFKNSGFSGDLIMPNSVTSIGYDPFYNCNGFSAVYYSGDIAQWCDIVFFGYGSNPLLYAHSLYINDELVTDLVIPETVTSIQKYAFIGGTYFTSLTIPNSTITIGNLAFYSCSSINSIVVFADTPPILEIEYNGITSVFTNVDKSIPVYIPYGTMTAYQAAPGWNEFTNYQELPAQGITQTFDLSAGWNWCSFYVDITLDDLKSALVETLPGTSITISSQTQSTVYNGTEWRGQLSTLDVAMMYKIMVTQGCELTLEGMPVNAAEHPVTISNGYNWIAYPLSQSMSLSNAFAGFAVSGDVVSSQTQNATYNGTIWRGTLGSGVLESGKGYKYNSNATEPRTFTYPSAK